MRESTRVGCYVWDIDIDKMSIEELKALEELCHDRIKQKQEQVKTAYREKLIDLLAEAAEHDVQLVLENEDYDVNLTAVRFDIIAEDKSPWVD